MSISLTTPELREIVQRVLANRQHAPDANLPNTNLLPTLYDCDGPGLSLQLAYHTMPWMTNPMGVVHGGIIAVMLDNSMGITCCCLDGRPTPTINLNINYARPVPLNTTVVVRTHVVVFGSTSAQTTAEIFLPEDPDRILVSASGVYYTKKDRGAPTQPRET